MVVQTNLAAMNANRMYGGNVKTNSKATEKLSSGYKINRAADDAAGLTISEKMRSQIRGLTQASSNCQDGVSFVQTADGALAEVNEMLHRAKELSVKAANGTLTSADREAIQAEMSEITKEIDRVKQSTQFNTLEIFPEEGYDPGVVSHGSVIGRTITKSGIEITWEFVDYSDPANPKKVDAVTATQGTGAASSHASSDLAQLAQNAASSAVDKLYTAYPKLFSAAATKGVTLGLELGNIDGQNGTAAYVWMSVGGAGGSTGMTYTLKVDTSDYKLSGPYTDQEKADLAAVIAHEMTHAFMDDTLTSGMLGGFPDWFVEGTAQTSSGDNGWISNRLNPSSSNADIIGVMSKLGNSSLGKYGSGYLAAMDLGYEVAKKAGDGSTMTSETIAKGLDRLLTEAARVNSLDQAIKNLTDYSGGISEFESKFKSGSGTTLQNIKDLLAARGASGAGSVLASSLATSELAAFKDVAAGVRGTDYYLINPDYTKVGNAINGTVTFPEAKAAGSGEDIIIQAGAQHSTTVEIPIMRFNISSTSLFGAGGVDLSEIDSAKEAMSKIDDASDKISAVRSYYGGIQNRLEHTINNLDNVVENTTAAESSIRDTDMATEILKYSTSNILMQASQSMLASANQSAQNVLSLLQ